MMIFPIDELLDEQRCYDFLLKVLHPEGLHCRNGHPLPLDQAPHDRHRDPIFDYRCRVCGNVHNIFTDTIWSGSRYSCVTIVLIIRGVVQGTPTKHLAEELGIDRSHLLKRRHAIQELAKEHLPRSPLTDAETEADEMYQNAGEKGYKQTTRTTHPAVGPTNAQGWELWKTTARRSWAWWDAHPTKSISPSVTTHSKRQSSPRSRPTPNQQRRSTLTSIRPTSTSLRQAEVMPQSATHGRSGPEMTTAMASAKSIATPWKVYGPACATSYDPSVVSIRNFWLSTRLCSSGRTTSSESRLASSEV